MMSLTSMKDDCHHHFRFKSKEVYTKLVKKFGHETIYGMASDSIRKQLGNIRKTLERSKKKHDDKEDSESEDEKEKFKTQTERCDSESEDEGQGFKTQSERKVRLRCDSESEDEGQWFQTQSERIEVQNSARNVRIRCDSESEDEGERFKTQPERCDSESEDEGERFKTQPEREVKNSVRKVHNSARKRFKTQPEREVKSTARKVRLGWREVQNSAGKDEGERFKTQPERRGLDITLRFKTQPDRDSDSEPEENQKVAEKKKVTGGQAWLHEGGDDDITDFMDVSASKKKKKAQADSGFKTAPDGRLIITESSEDEGNCER
ncbi:hypothetical protein DPMN_166004 [Dreissena polymorpha]|uniref:Uncharacterized protein n=1 Tax=Dreissena polymorpha TaxID=45954 RepID=A0A9D4EYN7_DREPO|nr:hypothetical protein DPMN_166004 [Dreissena polymorpha]